MSATAPATLAAARRLTEPAMRAVIDRLDPDTRRVCGYHLGYWAADGGPPDTVSNGKGIRPALALLSARANGAPAEAGVPAAVACELVHNFSLLHDDVMDGDSERRHRKTAWAVYGQSAAILAGDAMLSLASEVLAEAGSATVAWALRCLNAATRRLIAGQTTDLAFERRADVNLDECLRMASDKTAALLACSASLGAVLADAPARMAMGLADYGTHIGMAFQLSDDLLGIWGSPERTGKPVLSDLRSRKKSVPVVVALQSGTTAGTRLRDLYFRPDRLDEEALYEAADLVVAAGGRTWTEQAVEAHLSDALAILDELVLAGDVRDELEVLARMLSGRDR